ncbi:MAG: ABC transporter ATP-binding protein [Sedimentisphaerales bacterium]|nr:ABC transporter ATP-binding protein [Sedimentisphaerales bacterium]
MWYGFQDVLRDTLCIRSKSNRLRPREFWAVDDVSFELKRGDTLGIIGPNGSGKTTILRMLNGIIFPDDGQIAIKGRIGALIAVGAGFHPMLSGRENVYINGAILGMSKREIDSKFDRIVKFADIGDFLETPVKHYSSGMYVRLGFAVAVHCEPDILLVDEILAVGDIGFRAKCYEVIRQLKRKGVTIIFISHNLATISEICNKTMLLWKGQIKFIGDSEDAVDIFQREIFSESVAEGTRNLSDPLLGPVQFRSGAKIKSVRLLDVAGNECKTLHNGQEQVVETVIRFDKDVSNPMAGCFIWDNQGRVIHDINTFLLGINTGEFKAGKEYVFRWFLNPHLLPDHYNLGVDISQADVEHFYYDRRVKALILSVESNSRAQGFVDMDARLEIAS